MPRKASAKSREYSSIFYFSRALFLDLLKGFYYDYEKFCYVKDRINIYENYSDLQVFCLSCRSYSHLTKQCNYLTFQKRIIGGKAENEIVNNSGFKRKERNKFNSRSKKELVEAKSEEFYQENFALFEIESAGLRDNSAGVKINTGKFRKSIPFSALLMEENAEKEKGEFKESLDISREDSQEIEGDLNRTLSKRSITIETAFTKTKEFEKYDFMLNFEKMKTFELYFPHNNCFFIINKIKLK